jgi:hypothetical protein
MIQNNRMPDEAVTLLKIYLSGGSVPGNVNPLVLIEMAKQTGEYADLLSESKVIRGVRQRIHEHADSQGLDALPEVDQIKSYMLATDKNVENDLEHLFWLIESVNFRPE